MKATKHFSLIGILNVVVLAAFGLVSTVATAATVNAIYNSATDVPVTASGYAATGNTVNFTLNFAPATGTDLMVVSNIALPFINGTFDNLAQGQPVALSYGGVTYRFVANYYGGSGNDLVLVWSNTRPFAWGWNGYGQLGDNTTTNRLLPVPVGVTGVLAGKTLVAIAAGCYHSLALCSDGTVTAWGGNNYGQLGDNTTTNRLIPIAVNTASGVSALYGKRVVAIAAGNWHSLALCSDGTVAAWGFNQFGQLGDNTTNNSPVPLAVNTAPGVSALYGKPVVAVAAGWQHNLALCSDGTLTAWGVNSGRIGDNTLTDRHVPVVVNAASGISALYGQTVLAIVAGNDHSLALCSDGTVAAWGSDAFGQLGDNNKDPLTQVRLVPVAVNTNLGVSALYSKKVVAISAGYQHSLAQCSDGTVAAWGYNNYGQLGDSTTTRRNAPVAVNTATGVSVLSNKTAVAVATGCCHSLVLCSDGTAAAWGWNLAGQLGDNTTTNRLVPVAVNTSSLASGQCFTRICGGTTMGSQTLALVAAPPACEVTLTGAQTLTDGSFQFAFTNTPGAFFAVLAATNPALPLGNWTSLTGPTEVTPGQFQFTDPQATNTPQRFYRVRSP